MRSARITLWVPPRVDRAARTLWGHHLELWRHVVRCWRVYAALLLAGALATHYVGLNFTDSVPERLVWLEHGAQPLRGDLMVFRFHAQVGPAAPFDGTRWLKRVKGVPGDRITVQGRDVFINGVRVGGAVERTPRGAALSPIAAGTIPPGHYFVGGSSPDSLDSRYSDIGLVRDDQFIARAHGIF